MNYHADDVWSVAFSPDNRILASASGDNTVKLWDRKAEKLLHTWEEHTASVKTVAFSPDTLHVAFK